MGIFNQVAPKLAVYTHIVDPDRRRRASRDQSNTRGWICRIVGGRTGPDIDLRSAARSQFCAVRQSSPTITAVTNGSYQKHGIGGRYGHRVGERIRGSRQSVLLDAAQRWRTTHRLGIENDGLYFWYQATGQLNATLDPRITPGLWYVELQTSCIATSGAFLATVN